MPIGTVETGKRSKYHTSSTSATGKVTLLLNINVIITTKFYKVIEITTVNVKFTTLILFLIGRLTRFNVPVSNRTVNITGKLQHRVNNVKDNRHHVFHIFQQSIILQL